MRSGSIYPGRAIALDEAGGEYDPADRATQRIADMQYMSAESEVESSESSIHIQRMSLGPVV